MLTTIKPPDHPSKYFQQLEGSSWTIIPLKNTRGYYLSGEPHINVPLIQSLEDLTPQERRVVERIIKRYTISESYEYVLYAYSAYGWLRMALIPFPGWKYPPIRFGIIGNRYYKNNNYGIPIKP